jgi:hypothetical protein
MFQKSIVLSDETFHQTFFSSYKAFVNIGQRFINLAYLDTVRKKYIYLASEYFENDLDDVMLSEFMKKHHLTNEIPDIRFIFSNQFVHIIPESFLIKEEEENLFKFVIGEKKDILTVKGEYNVLVQFSIHQSLERIITEYSQSKIYHHAHALLGLTSWMDKKYNYKSSVYIHLYENYFEVVLKNNHQLILYNTYTYQNNDDILYYLHWLIKNMEINVKQNTFILTGWLDKKNDLIKKMKDFDFSIEWAKLNPQNIYSYRFNELQSHQFATLFSLPYENY